jgi:HSP20 family protein
MSALTLRHSAPAWCDWEPPVDLFDEGDAFTIVLEIPGVSQASISVVQNDRTVIITGVRPLQLEPGAHPHLEADYGRFHRLVELPSAIVASGRDVTYVHGLLTIHLPKCPLLAPA